MSNSVSVTYPGGGPDVTRRNKRSIIYIITGDPSSIPADTDPDGSLRLILEPGKTNPKFQLKANDVYNPTGLEVSSLDVGLDLTISPAPSFIKTFNPSAIDELQRALIPDITFDDNGTALSPQTPILKPIDTSVIFGPAVSQVVGTTIGINFNTTHARLIETLFHEVGTIGASAPVKHKIFVGTNNAGLLVKETNLGISEVLADQTLALQFNRDVGLRNNSPYFIELTSPTAFSLKTDSGGNPILSFLEQELGTLNMITENLMLDENLNLMFDESLNPMYSLQFL